MRSVGQLVHCSSAQAHRFDATQDKRPRPDGTMPSFRSDRKTTVGVEFATMVVTHPDGKRIKAQIWDTGEPLLTKYHDARSRIGLT